MLFIKVNRYRLEKAKKSPHLVPEKRSITRAGKTFMMTVWVDPTDKKKGKGKRSPVEDKTPSQMSLFDMGDLSGKPRKKETQKPKTKLGAFEYKLDGTTLMYKNPNADWKPLQDFYGSRDAEQALRGIQKYEDKGEIVNVREIPSHYLKTMINKVQAEKEADGYFATNPKGETEAEERAMAGYEVNGAKKQNKPEAKKIGEENFLDKIINNPNSTKKEIDDARAMQTNLKNDVNSAWGRIEKPTKEAWEGIPSKKIDYSKADKYLPIVSDSWEKLRKVDVYRLMNSSGDDISIVAKRITDKRPDLADEVDDCFEEIEDDLVNGRKGRESKPKKKPVGEYEVYNKSYTTAIDEVLKFLKKKNLYPATQEFSTEVTLGRGRPGVGKTVKHSLMLYKKDGTPANKSVNFQVYGMDKSYELNMYLSPAKKKDYRSDEEEILDYEDNKSDLDQGMKKSMFSFAKNWIQGNR